MGKEKNYCKILGQGCNRTEEMTCGGCSAARNACTEALSKMVKGPGWIHMMTFSATTWSETLTVHDQNDPRERIAEATVTGGILYAHDYRK